MSTSLAAQLRQLAVPSTSVLQDTKKRPSLLFDPREAASISGDVIFEIGQEGFQQLTDKDENFEQFGKNLFHVTAKEVDRNVQSQESNKKIDKTVRKFLFMVSPYILTNSAHKSLEWLIFRYRIHEFNHTDLITAILPFYTSNIFVRIIQMCKFDDEGDPFNFLNASKKFGVKLDRLTLFKQVQSNTRIVKCLIKFLNQLLKLHNSQVLTVHFNFYCTTLCGALETLKEVREPFLTELMPLILNGLNTDVPDFASTTYIIIAKILSKTSVSDKLLDMFVKKLADLKCKSLKLETTLLLVLIYQLQIQYNKLPAGVLDQLINAEWLPECLKYLHANGNCVYSFLKVVAQDALAEGISKKQSLCRSFIGQIVDEMEFDKPFVSILLSFLLDTLDKKALKDKELKPWIFGIFNKLQTKYHTFFQGIILEVINNDNTQHREQIMKAIKLSIPKSKSKTINVMWSNIELSKPDFAESTFVVLNKILKISNRMMLNVNLENDLESVKSDLSKLEADHPDKFHYYQTILRSLESKIESMTDNLDNVLHICATDLLEEVNLQKLLNSIKTTLSICETYAVRNFSTFISLMLLLSHTNHDVRIATLGIISELTQRKCQKHVLWVLSKFLSYKDELLAEDDQLPTIFANITTSAKGQEKNIISNLLDTACSPDTSLWIVNGILKFTAQFNNLEVTEKLCKYFTEIFKDKSELNDIESKVALNVTTRLDQAVAPYVTLDSYTYKFFVNVLQKNFAIKIGGESCQFRTLLLRQLSKDVYMLLPEEVTANLLETICNLAITSEDPEFLALSSKIFKHVDLNAKSLCHVFTAMSEIKLNRPANSKAKRVLVPTVEVLDTPTWKKGVCLLEFIQNKKKIRNAQVLLPVLFDIVKKCLDFEEQAVVEYPKQLALALILLICSKLDYKEFSEKDFNIELVIQCIRASQNPQTHYHALLVLTHAAKIVPSNVLQHVMTVFTFVGSTLVRHDDAYSFEIISKIVNTIIPVLIDQKKTTTISEVLRVFVDALLDVPEHRRISLYNQLLNHVNAKENFYLFLVFLLEAEIFQTARDKKKAEKDAPSKRIQFALELCNHFSLEVVLNTCCLLTKYLNNLPDDKIAIHSNQSDKYLINLNNYTAKQFRHFKYLIITFLATLLSSKPLMSKVYTERNNSHIESLYKELIINVLSYIQRTQKICDSSTNSPQALYWKTVLYHSYDLLDRVNDMLTSRMFLLVIKGLLMHSMVTVKKRALELLNTKLQNDFSTLKDEDRDELFLLTKPILLIIEPVAQQDEIPSDHEALVQTALLSVKLIVKSLGPEEPEKFVPVLDFVGNILRSGKSQGNILASVLLCLAELCVVLRGHALSSLTSFMPAFLSVLKKQKFQETSSLLLLSVVTATTKFLDSFASLLSPYLTKIICECSVLISKWSSSADDAKCQPLIARLNGIKKKIGVVIPARVLIPTIDECYDILVAKKYYNAVVALIGILEEQLTSMNTSDATLNLQTLTNLFLKTLEFRCAQSPSIDIANLVECQVVNTVTVFTLKLSESTFRPLYLKFFDWGVRSGNNTAKLITFYHLSEKVGLALKGLFVLFASTILNSIADVLRSIGSPEQDSSTETTSLLLDFVLKTLKVVFTYDNKQLINRDRFELLMQPLVDLLEKDFDGIDSLTKRNVELITPTIVQFAVAVADDGLWKEMNYQILLKMRNSSPEIRLVALHCLAELASKLREDFMPLLPETIPFLAELLEDEDERVERSCQKAIREMEKVLGEPLQKYF